MTLLEKVPEGHGVPVALRVGEADADGEAVELRVGTFTVAEEVMVAVAVGLPEVLPEDDGERVGEPLTVGDGVLLGEAGALRVPRPTLADTLPEEEGEEVPEDVGVDDHEMEGVCEPFTEKEADEETLGDGVHDFVGGGLRLAEGD